MKDIIYKFTKFNISNILLMIEFSNIDKVGNSEPTIIFFYVSDGKSKKLINCHVAFFFCQVTSEVVTRTNASKQ